MFLRVKFFNQKGIIMNKPTRKHTGRNVSRRHAVRHSSSNKLKLGNEDFYKFAAEADRVLELEYADEDPEGIRLSHK
ncbi:MAG TPA: hypothetical protein VF473_05080 [Cyclobacteriaceae bacterium]